MKSPLAIRLFAMLSIPCLAAGGLGDTENPSFSPDEALRQLQVGNTRFVSGTSAHPNTDAARMADTFQHGQHPFATVITCSDSRVPVERLFDQGIGDVFVIRVAGNVCDVDEIGSIEYCVDHLATPLMVVLGHTNCGAVTAVVTEAELHGSIPPLVDNIQPAVKRAMAEHAQVHGNDIIPYAIEENVWQGTEDLFMQSPATRELVESGKAKVVGAVHDVGTGRINWLPEQKTTQILAKVQSNPNRATVAMAGGHEPTGGHAAASGHAQPSGHEQASGHEPAGGHGAPAAHAAASPHAVAPTKAAPKHGKSDRAGARKAVATAAPLATSESGMSLSWQMLIGFGVLGAIGFPFWAAGGMSVFKRLGISKKIGLGFATVLVLLVVAAGVGWNGLNTASVDFGEYRQLARDTNLCGHAQASMLMVRMNVKDFLITGSDKDIEQYNQYRQEVDEYLAEAEHEIVRPEWAAHVKTANEDREEYEKAFEQVITLQQRRNQLVEGVLNQKGPIMEKTLSDLMISAEQDKDIEAGYRSGMALKHLLLARLYVIKFLESNEQAAVDRVHQELAELYEEAEILRQEIQNPDRRAMLAKVEELEQEYVAAFDQVVKAISERNALVQGTLDVMGPDIASNLEDVKLAVKAEQDRLGPEVQASNERAVTLVVGVAIMAILVGIVLSIFLTRSITKPLARIINQLNDGSDQVNDAANQVSGASQQLAEGASEQASSLEETSSALEQMAAMTRTNAENAKEANELATQAREAGNASDQTMGQLNAAMTGINESSDKISKIIKVIEEIAFQTNLLALNTAVEAARAGEHGKGFAVVAEEVRNLAQRAAQAAGETTTLIENSVNRAREGTGIASEVGKALGDIVTNVSKVTELINGIARASEEQAQGIEQVNIAVSQMDKVTQQNAAESASASEQLSAQSQTVRGMVDELARLMTGGSGAINSAVAPRPVQTAGAKQHFEFKAARLTNQTRQPRNTDTGNSPSSTDSGGTGDF